MPSPSNSFGRRPSSHPHSPLPLSTGDLIHDHQMAIPKKPEPPIHRWQHDLTPAGQRACWSQPIPATARDQLGFILTVVLRDVTFRKPKIDPDTVRRDTETRRQTFVVLNSSYSRQAHCRRG